MNAYTKYTDHIVVTMFSSLSLLPFSFSLYSYNFEAAKNTMRFFPYIFSLQMIVHI